MSDVYSEIKSILEEANKRMDKTIEAFKKELNSIRSSRANPSILDGILVEYYGTEVPINQIATISVPEARLIVIQPYDKNSLTAIEKAIQKSDLNINPQNDGSVIRLVLPEMTKERRLELVKQVKQKLEEAKVAIRNVRRDSLDDLKKITNISKDEQKHYQDEVQKITDKHIKILEDLAHKKEESIMQF
ncbi:MAG: ribosome recycling factor [Leptospiraceae bacterium]|nr:ribosome recycling factor [Leptospiraceae bacterium]MDW7976690.1 ribosome recycling factor [Leptospiraceae bacterium]